MDHYARIDAEFLARFPQGLSDPGWLALGKKHQSYHKVIRLCQEDLSQARLEDALQRLQMGPVSEACRQVISLSTTVSSFEKIAFRNFLAYRDVHHPLIKTLNGVLYNFGPDSFAAFVEALSLCKQDKHANAAKWPIVSCFLAYHDPQRHVCIKPTTIKKLAARLGVDIQYQATPNYNTYLQVQQMVNSFRQHSSLAKNQNNIIAQAIMYCSI